MKASIDRGDSGAGRIGLGTAQFGLDYGIANSGGKTAQSEVTRILELARDRGLDTIDTATLYGNAETVLGECLPSDHNFRIVTKTPQFRTDRIDDSHSRQITDSFHGSLKKMRQERLYGLMVHAVDDLLADGGERIYRAMLSLKETGCVERIGVSVYTGNQIDRILENYDIDLIQVPFNVFDQRLINSGHLKRLKENNVEIHARSAFLQGLLLMKPTQLPSNLSQWSQRLEHYRAVVAECELTPVQAALGFVLDHAEIDRVILGVCNRIQLEEICDAVQLNHIPLSKLAQFSNDDEFLLNPSNWQ